MDTVEDKKERIVGILKWAQEKMAHHGLTHAGWTLCVDSAKSRLGQCRYDKREIGISRDYLIHGNVDMVRDTILHEIAHALTPGDNHGWRWQRKCLEIGANPRRTKDEGELGEALRKVRKKSAKYVLGCASCSIEYPVFRALKYNPEEYRCSKCRGKLVLK